MKPPNIFSRRIIMVSCCVLLSALAIAAAVLIGYRSQATASSHREAPLISQDAYADNTDTYVFVSPQNPDNLVLAASWIPFEGPEGGPNYFEWGKDVLYDIHVDNNGDAVADVTYTLSSKTTVQNGLTFLYNTGPIGTDGSNWNRQQTYTVTETTAAGTIALVSDVLAPPVNIGSKSTPDYDSLEDAGIYIVNENGDEMKIFAGQTDDAFWVDLQVFDLLTLRGQDPPIGYAKGNNDPVDSVAGFNVHSLVIEVPIARLTQGDEPVLGVWATARRPSMRVLNGLDGLGTLTNSGAPVQVSRLGMPLVNEVVVPMVLKDAFNTLLPSQDLTIYTDPTFGPILQKSVEDPELGNLLCGLYGVPLPGDSDDDCSTEVEIGTPRSGRGDIFDIFLTGMVLADEFTIQTESGPVTLPAGFNVNQPMGAVPAEMIRINTAIKGDLCAPTPSRLGVLGGDACGFPNGRRLFDDTVEIELLAVAGAAYGVLDGRDADFAFDPALIGVLDDGIDANDRPFRSEFPYMALAQSGQEHIHDNPMADGVDMASVTSRIANATDDAEEMRSGYVKVNSTDLELGQARGKDQTVGVRFPGLDIPPGATIVNAYIEFVAEDADIEDNGLPTSLLFHGEASANAATFSTEGFDISSRSQTAANVAWTDIPAWDEVGETHWTPNLTPIVQEIVNGDGWSRGHAMAFIVTGSGTRSAWAVDGKPSAAPLLYVEYTTDAEAIARSDDFGWGSGVVSSSILNRVRASDDAAAPDDDATEEALDNEAPAPDGSSDESPAEDAVYLPLITQP